MEDAPVSQEKGGGAHEGSMIRSGFANVLGEPGGPPCKFTKIKMIGAGSYGEAWLIERTEDKKILVAKIMDLSVMSKKDEQYAFSEVRCLAHCHHFAIIKYYDDVEEDNQLLIIMEYADSGDLNKLIKSRAAQQPPNFFSESEVVLMFVQLILSIDHIHRKHILHRDIKGANIMLTQTGLVKLGDFGFSQQYEETVSKAVAGTFCGTPYYLAPELWKRKRYSKKADVWALGILLHEMLALKRPYLGSNMSTLMASVMNGEVTPLPSFCSKGVIGVINALLIPDPERRPGTSEVIRMPYIQTHIARFKEIVNASTTIGEDVKSLVNQNIAESSVEPMKMEMPAGNAGSIKFESTVRKESGGVWKERFLSLKDGALYIYARSGDDNGKALPVSSIASVVPVPKAKAGIDFVFSINTTTGRMTRIQADSGEQRVAWLQKIQLAMGIDDGS